MGRLPSSDKVPQVNTRIDENKVNNTDRAKAHNRHVPYKNDFYKIRNEQENAGGTE